MYVTLDHVEQLSAAIATFWFKPERPLRFTAGQFIELYLPHDHPDSRGQKHWFTLSSSPTEQLISITTRFATEGGSTFKNTLRNLKPGAVVMISDPMGDFVLPKDTTLPLVFVAGGIGVTPLRSMTKWLADNQQQRQTTLVHVVTRTEELVFRPLFEARYQDRFVPFIGQPAPGWQGHTGRPDAEQLLQLATDGGVRSLFFLSGPESMVKSIEQDLQAHSIARHRIITDYFPGYPARGQTVRA